VKARIRFAASALAELESVLRWYEKQGAAEAGRRIVADIVGRIEALADHPDNGRVVPEFGIPNLREIQRPPSPIVYRHDGGLVRVVRTWRGERPLRLP